ncbi:MAG: DUF2634 domain-containing protein [Lachnospiraceae bacterium]|nr:DUF2634 domain-containing protein [Lachnospiraceae bacterium]
MADEYTADETTIDASAGVSGGYVYPDDTTETDTETDSEEEEVVEDDDDDEDYDGDMESVDFGFDPENIEEGAISRTYGIDLVHHRIKGFVDDKDAVIQAIWKALSTVRYANYIYDDDYGCDLMNRIYNSSLSEQYLNTDVPAMVEEALSQDDRIKGIKDFQWEKSDSDGVIMSFTAETIYGDMPIESEV